MEEAPVVLRADRESEDNREVAEDVPALELLNKLAPAVDEPADDGVALMMGIVLSDRVDEGAPHNRARKRTVGRVTGESLVGAVGIEELGAFFDGPPVVGTGGDELDFFEVVLADVADVEVTRFHVEREPVRVPQAKGEDLFYNAAALRS